MNEAIFQEIKQKALDEHIPIIMDNTLDAISKILEGKELDSILEIGTAVRIFCNLLF